jgi:hypothetical protein
LFETEKKNRLKSKKQRWAYAGVRTRINLLLTKLSQMRHLRHLIISNPILANDLAHRRHDDHIKNDRLFSSD